MGLQPLDNEFFEEYKRLDQLCSDMYACRNGVSQYLADMETKPYRVRQHISGWDYTYQTLKRLRWIRNRIAHESGQSQICHEQDIQEIHAIYNAILSGQDPLALLTKFQSEGCSAETSADRAPTFVHPRKRLGCFTAVLVLLGMVGCILAVIFL